MSQLSPIGLVALAVYSSSALAGFTGTIGQSMDVTQMQADVERAGDKIADFKLGKIEYALVAGQFRHTDLEEWSFKYRVVRQQLFEEGLDGSRGEANTESAISARWRRDQGNWGWGAILYYENNSANNDNLYAIVPHFDVQINDRLEFRWSSGLAYEDRSDYVNDKAMGDYRFFTLEPHVLYQLSPTTVVGIETFYESGESDGDYKKREQVITPFIGTRWGQSSLRWYTEFDQWQEDDIDGDYIYTALNYATPLTPAILLKAEVYYEDGTVTPDIPGIQITQEYTSPGFIIGFDYRY